MSAVGVATARSKTGADGGMHPVFFLAKLQSKSVFDFRVRMFKAPSGPLRRTSSAAPARAEMTAAVAAPAPNRARNPPNPGAFDRLESGLAWRQRTDGARSTGRREA